LRNSNISNNPPSIDIEPADVEPPKKLEKKKKQSTAEAKQEDMQINTTTGTSNLG
jgi:hypothetical protein